MKRLAVVLVLVLAPVAVMAGWADVVGDILEGAADSRNDGNHSDGRSDGRGGYGDVSCRASDSGWEEHWGGHSDCGACLDKHGSCVEVCSATMYACDAQGIDRNGNSKVVSGKSQSDRRSAMNEALDECEFQGLTECRTENCRSNNEVVSRRTCRERR